MPYLKSSRSRARALPAGLLALVSWALAGCDPDARWDFGRKEPPPEPKPGYAPHEDVILAGTIGQYTLLSNAEPLRLRGYGLVRGLGEDGSADCPTTIREYLLDYLKKELIPNDGPNARPVVSPSKLIDSLDTAVVEVTGFVPAGAPKGATFDLYVQAVGNQTRTLEGGSLLACELKIFSPSAEGRGLVAGRTLARGAGPVFTSPTPGSDPAAGVRKGTVLGGGVTLEARSFRLLLNEPSYTMARKIDSRINERFGQRPRVAEAMSNGFVELRTPAAYADRPEHFLRLVPHLMVDAAPALYERRLRELNEEVKGGDERLDHLSLAWEAIGRVAIPTVQPRYSDSDPAIAYYACRAGLRLRDINAVEAMGRIAATPGHKYRLAACEELGFSHMPQAARQLAPLLSDSEEPVRIAAYEAMLSYKHPAIQSRPMRSPLDASHYNVILDIVESTARPMIYVSRTREPRLAVFGPRTPVLTPIFYNHPRDWVTLNSQGGEGDITVFCRTRQSGVLSDALHVPPRVVDLVRSMADVPVGKREGDFNGIGLPYSLVVRVLQELESRESLTASVVMGPESVVDLLAPLEAPERPEADNLNATLEPPADSLVTGDAPVTLKPKEQPE